MNKQKLKYQNYIEKYTLGRKCPFEDCNEASGDGFHFIRVPIDDKLNFLPTVIRKEIENRPIRQNSPDDYFRCSACGLSMFISKEYAVKKFSLISDNQRLKLGYTHIAYGKIGIVKIV